MSQENGSAIRKKGLNGMRETPFLHLLKRLTAREGEKPVEWEGGRALNHLKKRRNLRGGRGEVTKKGQLRTETSSAR